jgi:hypothetical protein
MGTIGSSSAGVLFMMLLALRPGTESPTTSEPREVTVAATDYAFLPLPVIKAGPTLFSFVNQGKVNHEVAIVRLKPTSVVETYVKTPPGPERTAQAERSVGILIAAPGMKPDGKIWVDLRKGATYVVLCNFRDKPDAPQHIAMGMYTTFIPR